MRASLCLSCRCVCTETSVASSSPSTPKFDCVRECKAAWCRAQQHQPYTAKAARSDVGHVKSKEGAAQETARTFGSVMTAWRALRVHRLLLVWGSMCWHLHESLSKLVRVLQTFELVCSSQMAQPMLVCVRPCGLYDIHTDAQQKAGVLGTLPSSRKQQLGRGQRHCLSLSSHVTGPHSASSFCNFGPIFGLQNVPFAIGGLVLAAASGS
jgi:hypothetical protein